MRAQTRVASNLAQASYAHAMRSWLASILAQTHQARLNLEAEIERLQGQIERVDRMTRSMEESIAHVDSWFETAADLEGDPGASDERSSERTTESESKGSKTGRGSRAGKSKGTTSTSSQNAERADESTADGGKSSDKA